METKTWICPECGQTVVSREKPQPIRWTDGHVCEAWLDTESEDAKALGYTDPDDYSGLDPASR